MEEGRGGTLRDMDDEANSYTLRTQGLQIRQTGDEIATLNSPCVSLIPALYFNLAHLPFVKDSMPTMWGRDNNEMADQSSLGIPESDLL